MQFEWDEAKRQQVIEKHGIDTIYAARIFKGQCLTRVDRRADYGEDFWANAKLEGPVKSRSVHLKLDPDVFDFFYRQANGKGHLTRMQAVLKAYAKAHKPS